MLRPHLLPRPRQKQHRRQSQHRRQKQHRPQKQHPRLKQHRRQSQHRRLQAQASKLRLLDVATAPVAADVDAGGCLNQQPLASSIKKPRMQIRGFFVCDAPRMRHTSLGCCVT
ncbi:hypothetical protein QFZ99_004374 [Paraburkholderia atlantica]